jgi:hypothetical protein
MTYSAEFDEFSDRLPFSALVNVVDQRVGKSLFATDQNTYSIHITALPLICVRVVDAQNANKAEQSFTV